LGSVTKKTYSLDEFARKNNGIGLEKKNKKTKKKQQQQQKSTTE
jgi:hypothetical protein